MVKSFSEEKEEHNICMTKLHVFLGQIFQGIMYRNVDAPVIFFNTPVHVQW
jgi:hypothetical protein